MVLKAVKMRIYPNSEQRDRLMQTFGCARFVWNQMLNMQIERRKNNPDAKFVNAFGINNLLKRLKEEYPWLKQAESTSLQSANRNLADAFQRFFKGQNKFPHLGVRTFFWTLTIKLSCSDGIFVGSFLLKLFFFSWCYTTQYIH